MDIRPKNEIEKWVRKDPIKRFARFLIKNRIIKKVEIDRIHKEVGEEVREAHQFAKASPSPNPNELMRYVFKE